jgi:SAM-dependent methyltransferase
MTLLADFHETSIHSRRVLALARLLSNVLPASGTVLDVGCGDGLLASLLARKLPAADFRGLDVLVRSETQIPVEPFDGVQIPLADDSVDVVMMIDVLHHTEDPEVLLREAQRVAKRWVILKDHTRNGLFANSTLRFMDWVGNAHHGVALPYNYLSKAEWDQLFLRVGLTVDQWNDKPSLYGPRGDWLFGRSLHFIARLAKN